MTIRKMVSLTVPDVSFRKLSVVSCKLKVLHGWGVRFDDGSLNKYEEGCNDGNLNGYEV